MNQNTAGTGGNVKGTGWPGLSPGPMLWSPQPPFLSMDRHENRVQLSDLCDLDQILQPFEGPG